MLIFSILFSFCISLSAWEQCSFAMSASSSLWGEAGERLLFYKKNIPYSDNSACKGITLNNKKSKELKDTDCLSSIASHHKGYCFVASVGVHFDNQ